MSNSNEKNKEIQFDPYLESPKAFHLEMPLYRIFDLTDKTIAEKVYQCVSYNDTIDAYCIWCEKESVFEVVAKGGHFFY